MKIRDIIETNTEREITRELIQLRKQLVREMRLNEADNTTSPPARPPSFFKSLDAEKFVKWLKTGSKIGILALLAEPIYDYITNMNAAWKNFHDRGGSIEQYNEDHMNKAGMLVASLAANLGSVMVTGIGSSIFISMISFIPIIGPILARILSLVSVGAKAYILTRLNSPEGQLAIAKAITGTTIRDTGKFAVAAIDYIHEIVADALKLDKSTITPTNASPTTTSSSSDSAPADEVEKPLPKPSSGLIDPLHANPGGYVPPGHYRDAYGVLH